MPPAVRRSMLLENFRERWARHISSLDKYELDLEKALHKFHEAQQLQRIKEAAAKLLRAGPGADAAAADAAVGAGSFMARRGSRRMSARSMSIVGASAAAAAAAAAAGAGGGYIAEDDEIPPEVAAIVGPRPAFRLLLPTPQLNALIEEALEAVTMQRGGELHTPE